VLDGVGHVGRARRYALVPEPSDLQGEFIGAAVRVGWAWPEGHRLFTAHVADAASVRLEPR
jgi:hypothetical protein